MYFRPHIFILVLLLISVAASAQRNNRNKPMPIDSNVHNRTVTPYEAKDSERTEKFYDSLHSKSTRKAFPRMLYHSVFRRRRDTTKTGMVIDEAEYYKKYEGRTIGKIVIDREDIYEDATKGMKRFLNQAHVMTRRKVIKRDLLFKSGDKLDPQELVRNKHIILYRPYIGVVNIKVTPQEIDSMVVDVHIYTMDKWSIGVTGSFRSRGRTMLEVYDDNIFGTGNKFAVQTSFNSKKFSYEGNGFEYEIPNILGTFYQANFYGGKYFYDEVFRGNISKDFITPTDYMLGIYGADERLDYYMLYADSSDAIKLHKYDVWAGKSYHLRSINSSIYFTGGYSFGRFTGRPGVSERFNPAFHHYKTMLYSVGLYREKFYAANMIYGYGFQEYVAAGYQAELVGGFNWGEFRKDYYVGINIHQGNYYPFGYMRFDMGGGTFIDHNTGRWWQAIVDFNATWFSNLFHFRKSSMRQFLSLRHTRGWNRGEGCSEVIHFTSYTGPRAIREWMVGRNRLVLNTETVFFTPFKPAGFKMAMFGWADIATLGNNNSVFQNNFYSSLGFGVRLKNERLTFSAIELRLGIALGKGGYVKSEFFRLSSERRMRDPRFIPTAPQIERFE